MYIYIYIYIIVYIYILSLYIYIYIYIPYNIKGTIQKSHRSFFRCFTTEITVKHVGMMAGGTGITPMLQVVQAALRDSNDSCNFYMRLGGSGPMFRCKTIGKPMENHRLYRKMLVEWDFSWDFSWDLMGYMMILDDLGGISCIWTWMNMDELYNFSEDPNKREVGHQKFIICYNIF